MANSNRDVELVIKAKNEASKALDAVTNALDQLTKAQSDVVNGTGKTTSVLSRFGAELGKLAQQVGGLSTFDRISNSVNKAATSVARLEQSVSSLADEQGKLAGDIAKSEAAVAKFTAESQRLEAQLQQQKAATSAAKKDLTELNTAVASGGTELKKRISDNGKFEASLTRQEAALTRTQQRHRDLTQQLLAADAPSANLVAAFTKIDIQLASQTTKLATARTAYAANREAIAQLGSSLDTMRQQQAASNIAFENAKSAQATTASSLKTVGLAAKETARNLIDIRVAADNNVAATARQNEALAKARTELTAVESAAAQAGVALDKIGMVARQGLLRSLADSQIALAKYRAEWQATTAAISAGMKNQAPGAALTPELTALIEKAKLSKAAVLEMQVALQQMRTAVREAGTDVNKLAAAEQIFTAALDRVKVSADASAAAQARVNALTAATSSSASSAGAALGSLAQATSRQASAAAEAGAEMDKLDGRGRQALSWTQRLRGELVALTTAYIGFFAAIQQLGGVVTTFQTIEAAQSRLNVAFDGNSAVVGREFRFIRDEADRLGISLGTLSNEYSKFAIATRGSTLEGEQTRKIFISVAEAARVNKLSIEQIQGTFLALTQMVSKGTVSMEELRQQLGERLYGAFTIAAKGMGLTTAQLDKLVSSGNLATEDFLPKFAEQLNKTFGGQLSKSLLTLTTQLGQFQNELFKAQENVANGGFVEGLTVGLKSLTEFFRSDEGKTFFSNLGAAAGGFIKLLAQIPNYTTPITAVFSLWLGMKILGFVQNLGTNFKNFVTSLKPVAPAMAAVATSTNAFAAVGGVYNTQVAASAPLTQRLATSLVGLTAGLRTSAGTMTAASVAAGTLTAGLGLLRGALAAIGGLPGLIVTGLSLAFTYWMTGTEKATNAVDEHKKQVVALLDAYSLAKQGADDWAKSVRGVTLAGAQKTGSDLADTLKAQTEDLAKAVSGKIDLSRYTPTPFFSEGFGDPEAAIKGLSAVEENVVQLGNKLKSGDITIADYSKALNDILKDNEAPERLKKLIIANAELLEKSVETEKAVAENGIVIQQMGGNASAVQPLIDKLGLSLGKLAEESGLVQESKPADPMAALNKQIDILKGKIPSMKDELKRLEDLKELDEILKTANLIEGLDKSSEAYKRFLNLVSQAQADINNAFNEKQFKEITTLLTTAGNGAELSSKLIKQFEGFQPVAKYDVNAYRAGFGSDTVTLSDGSVQKVVQGMKVSVEDANRDLLRRIDEFQNTVKGQVGTDRFNSFNPQQQAALTSIAYNYGSLPGRIIDAVKTGSSEQIATAIRGLRGDNNGINSGRRDQEAAIFQQGPTFNPEGMSKVYEQQLQTAKEFHDVLAGQLDVKNQQAEADKRISLEDAIQLEVTKAQNAAKKAGTELTAKELEQIKTNVTAAQAKKQAEWDIVDAKKAQVEGEQKIATLQQLRRDLLEQMKFAQGQGDLVAYDKLKTQLNDVSGQLDVAINKMIQFWEASGNTEKAQAAIASLQNIKNSLVAVGQQGILTGQNIGKAFGQGLFNTVDNFVDKVAETGNVFEAAKEAFRSFAIDFLKNIAKMILQQLLFNAIKAGLNAFGGAGSIGAGIASVGASQLHSGGIAGAPGTGGSVARAASPSWFSNAVRYHTGGVAGLKSDEIPAVLQRGETIRTTEQEAALSRQMAAAGSGGGGTPIKIINQIDSGEMTASGLGSAAGERAFINTVSNNRDTIKRILG